MNILLLGPNHDNESLPPYLKVLYNAFLECGVNVDWEGSKEIPYDKKNKKFHDIKYIIDSVQSILSTINFSKYDIISLHYGNLEIEQLIPYVLQGKPHPPIIYHVHTLEPTLFKNHVVNRNLSNIVEQNRNYFSGCIFFGNYAREKFNINGKPNTTAWLPTTILPDSSSNTLFKSMIDFDDELPVFSLYGFAAPWKDLSLLLSSMKYIKTQVRFIIAGPFWDDSLQSGVELKLNEKNSMKINNSELVIIPKYVDEQERLALVRRSYCAVFPYQSYKSFQGSGAIADYLVNGIPVIATDIANMSEVIGEVGIIVPSNNPKLFAGAVDNMLKGNLYNKLKAKAQKQAYKFTSSYHARKCLDFYRKFVL